MQHRPGAWVVRPAGTPTVPILGAVLNSTPEPRDLLKRAEAYLSALHGSVARHDNLAANLACAGCELRDQIAAVLAAAVSVAVPPTSQERRDRYAQALYVHDHPGWRVSLWEAGVEPVYRERAAAVLAVADAEQADVRAAAYRQLADRQTQLAVADDLERRRDLAVARRQLVKELRRMAACHECETGAAHTEHCPTPETHNWGCGCPTDVAAAVASCPGREMVPSPCRCPCYGCKHHCGAHDPDTAAVLPQPETQAGHCGRTKSVCDTEYPPCGRPAGHEEAYCHSADGNGYFLATAPAVVSQPDEEATR